MRNLKRFQWEVKKGKYKGGLHVPTKAYYEFHKDLSILSHFLESGVTHLNPEEAMFRNILLVVQSVLEYEIEDLIKREVEFRPSKKNLKILNKMKTHYVSFYEKYKWLFNKRILTKKEFDVINQITKIRNKFTHFKPDNKRIKETYFGHPVMTSHSVRNIVCDAQYLLVDLNKRCGINKKWRLIPGGFPHESNWTSYLSAGKKRKNED